MNQGSVMLILVALFLVELAMEARKFSLIQMEYLKECIRRSGSPAIYRTMKTPVTSNAAVSQFKNDLGFLVRLFLEIMQGKYQTNA